MNDIGHKLTDKELAALEKRIRDMYKASADELSDVINDYFEKFKTRDEKQKALLEAGEITEEQYKNWRLAQIGRGERFEKLRDDLAERIYKANEVAAAYINDATPGIYSLNRNYAAYTIEQVAGNVGFTLWDEQTVRRLLVDEPNLMPHYPEKRAVRRGIDLAYSKQQITASVTSGILQGKAIGGIAKDLQQRINTMEWSSAVRAARTAVTGAQNAGRQDTYERAAQMGIKVRKRWIATKDMRTRHEHGAADGQTVDIDEPFIVGGEEMMFPGDRNGSAWNVYNCRCTMRTVEKEGIEAEPRQMRVRNPETGRNEVVSEMTYQEWINWKEAVELNRNTVNRGAFAVLPERMSKKHVRKIAKELDISLKGITLVIDRDESKLNPKFTITGRADAQNVGRVDLFPLAFSSREELARTLFHEKQHVEQFKKHGAKYVQRNREAFEAEAYEAENKFIEQKKKEGKL